MVVWVPHVRVGHRQNLNTKPLHNVQGFFYAQRNGYHQDGSVDSVLHVRVGHR